MDEKIYKLGPKYGLSNNISFSEKAYVINFKFEFLANFYKSVTKLESANDI